jgi:DeoR family suf operon transcriptional repressor
VPDPALTTVTEGQRGVLEVLKEHGPTTVEAVAAALGITVSGARQQLSALVEEGLARSEEVAAASPRRGRPRPRYALTERAEPLFPKAYGDLANELLAYLHPGGEDELFDRRRDARIERARARLGHGDLASRVAELARILDEDGYLATWEPIEGGFRIAERNCAILAVAQRHPSACRSEIEFIRAVLPDATVERVSHIVSGAHQCAYEVRPAAVG